MLEITSKRWKNHILFRDYLREHPNKAKLYSELKWQLVQKYKHNREAYTDGKAPFIKEILKAEIKQLEL